MPYMPLRTDDPYFCYNMSDNSDINWTYPTNYNNILKYMSNSKLEIVKKRSIPKFNSLNIIKNNILNSKLNIENANILASKRMKKSMVYCVDSGNFMPEAKAVKDYFTNIYYEYDNMLRVFTKNEFGVKVRILAHPTDVHKFAFQCWISCAWFDYNHYSTFSVDGSIACQEQYLNEVYVWESDGLYHRDPEPEPTVAGYHSISRPEWWTDAKGYGIELEIFCKKRGKFAAKLPKYILAEEDGSLDRQFGVELIGGPYSYLDYKNHKTPWNKVTEIAHEYDSVGHSASGNYGMHVSISKKLFTVLDLAKFVVFFNTQIDLCKCIAQRDTIYSGDYGIRPKLPSAVNMWREFKTSKYEAVCVSEKRVEVRIFRSNLRYERILKNIEFCEAVKRFVEQAPLHVCSSNEGTPKFLDWLNKQSEFFTLKKFLHSQSPRSSVLSTVKNLKLKVPNKNIPHVELTNV